MLLGSLPAPIPGLPLLSPEEPAARLLVLKGFGTYPQKAISLANPHCENKLQKQWGWGSPSDSFHSQEKQQ